MTGSEIEVEVEYIDMQIDDLCSEKEPLEEELWELQDELERRADESA